MSITNTCQQVLRDLQEVVAQIPQEIYAQSIEMMYSASIGQHTRHILEFFQCLAQQLDSLQIDYDLRKRNMSIEQSPLVAAQTIEDILLWLEQLPPTDYALQLVINYNLQSSTSKDSVASSLHRELVYNIEHAIHHAALIKVALHCLAPQIQVPSHFGVAPSTIRYQRVSATAAAY